MREIALTRTPTLFGGEENAPVTVYDTSGPYTDPQARVDLSAGLPALRRAWIEERGDTEQLDGLSSSFGRDREHDPKLDAVRFPARSLPRRARSGANVTQMHYARRGIITPEMEFVAIRENQRLDAIRDAGLLQQHRAKRSVRRSRRSSPLSSCATRSPVVVRCCPTTSTIRKASR